jgi:hypothetical protein
MVDERPTARMTEACDVAVVTGANRGIGLEVVRQLAAAEHTRNGSVRSSCRTRTGPSPLWAGSGSRVVD